MRILHFVHTDESGSFRVGSYHIARELVDLGINYKKVLPWSIFYKTRINPRNANDLKGIALLPSKLYRKKKIWKTVIWINSIVYSLILLLRFAKERWWPDFVIVDSLYFFGVSRIFGVLGVKVMVRMTDFLWDMDETLEKDEAKKWTIDSIQKSDVVVATNSELAYELHKICQKPVSCIPNGVDWNHFAKHELISLEENDTLKIVYFGALDKRINYDLLFKISSLDDVTLSVIGNFSKDLKLGKNGIFLGEVEYDELPNTIYGSHIGILPFNNTKANHGRFPMKFFEYAASGLTIISFPFPGIKQNIDCPGILFTKDYSDDSYLQCISQVKIMYQNKDKWSKMIQNLREYSKSNSWRSRTESYINLITAIQ
jgi:teichuronic acid biosynthesis glycosyltransferase TuaH